MFDFYVYVEDSVFSLVIPDVIPAIFFSNEAFMNKPTYIRPAVFSWLIFMFQSASSTIFKNLQTEENHSSPHNKYLPAICRAGPCRGRSWRCIAEVSIASFGAPRQHLGGFLRHDGTDSNPRCNHQAADQTRQRTLHHIGKSMFELVSMERSSIYE